MDVIERRGDGMAGPYGSAPAAGSTYAYTALQTNLLEAESVIADQGAQYALLLTNDRLDDEAQLAGAGRERANAQAFLSLFHESFQQFRHGAAYQQLQRGQAVRWRPTLRDHQGRPMGGFPPVLLVPTTDATGHPLVRITLPRHNWVAQLGSAHPATPRPEGVHLERAATPQTRAWLADHLGESQAGQVLARLLTPAVGYDPTLPSHFTRALHGQRLAHPPLPIEELARRLPLERVTRWPAGRLEGRQRLAEWSFGTQTASLHLTPDQEKALLLGHGLAATGGVLTYQPHTGRLDWNPPVVLRPLQPGEVELVTGQLLRQLRRAQLPTGPVDISAFGQQYENLFKPTRLYDPADPVQFYGHLATLTRQAIALTGPLPRQETALHQFVDEQFSRGELMQVLASPGQLRALVRTPGPLTLEGLERLVGPAGRRRFREAMHVATPDALTQYKGVTLTARQRTDLLAGRPVALQGLRDPNRASLYAATITLPALHGQFGAGRPGQTEHLQTDSRREAAAHPTLTGGASTTTSTPAPSDVHHLRTRPGQPTDTAPRPKLY